MKYDAATDTYRPIEWEVAFREIGATLQRYTDPDCVEFYTSGRTSNEAAFLYQLFTREYGTNNFPDCSNMCHEPTSVGLPASIDVGKGTVTLEDFEHCDLVMCIGHNPGTNHPRMLATLRGHSNVQGDRTVGITEIPSQALLDGIKRTFGFTPPAKHGHAAVASIRAIQQGSSKALICLGGNLATAMPDPDVIFAAMRKLELVVHMATKLNRSHLLLAKNSYLLPVLGRTEKDRQASGSQSITVEDSMSMVHVSRGTLPNSKVPWEALVADYARIRDAIASVFPAFKDYNTRIQQPGGFRLYNAASERQSNTPNGRAQFIIMPGINEDPCGSPHHELLLIIAMQNILD